ncbi:MAG TPA: phage minor head protein [Nevskiales bacterium]|nr:phage minor head protein [Nevskiales bacterium]
MPPELTSPGPIPKEAIEYLRAKKLAPEDKRFHWTDVWREEHAVQFTVAKAVQTDILEDIRGAVDQALEQGQTLRDFSRQLRPKLEQKGWWGIREQTDPITGETRQVQLGSPRRLKTIYQANMRTARAAGQWDRIERTKKALPYLLYVASTAREPRVEHRQWYGLLLPVDDPFWKTHMPPNGWGCKCSVRQVSGPEAERLDKEGFQDPTAPPVRDDRTGLPTGRLQPRRIKVIRQAPPVRTREWVNGRTGEVMRVPVGIDPGWDTNPGQVSRLARALKQYSSKLEGVTPEIAQSSVRTLFSAGLFKNFYEKPDGDFPVAIMPRADAERIGSKTTTVLLSKDTVLKQRDAHPEISAEEYIQAQEAINRGRRIQDSPNTIVFLLNEPGGHVTVVKSTRSGNTLFMTSFRRLSGDPGKLDRELRRLLAGDD